MVHGRLFPVVSPMSPRSRWDSVEVHVAFKLDVYGDGKLTAQSSVCFFWFVSHAIGELGAFTTPWSCEPHRPAQESLGPFGPKVSRECPQECPRKPGVSARALRATNSRVSEVSQECPGVSDTFLTLEGHSPDTIGRWTLRSPGHRGPAETSWGTPSDTPCVREHSRDTSGLKGSRDSCSRPGAFTTP